MVKKKGWTLNKLIACGSLGVLSLLLQLPATALVGFIGIPLIGGLINIFIARTIESLTILTIDKFGAATLQNLVVGILAIPFLYMGPPGFLPKLIIVLLNGLIIDILFLFGKNKKISAMLSIGIASLLFGLYYVQIGRYFAIPGIEETAKIFLSPLMMLGTFMAGATSGYLGWVIYNKIKKTAIVKRIQK